MVAPMGLKMPNMKFFSNKNVSQVVPEEAQSQDDDKSKKGDLIIELPDEIMIPLNNLKGDSPTRGLPKEVLRIDLRPVNSGANTGKNSKR